MAALIFATLAIICFGSTVYNIKKEPNNPSGVGEGLAAMVFGVGGFVSSVIAVIFAVV